MRRLTQLVRERCHLSIRRGNDVFDAGDRLVLAERPSLHLAQLLRRQLRQPSTEEHS